MDDETKTYRVLRLIAENYKRLQAVDITPNKTAVEIHGKNKAGKSSLLDAIAAALGGKKEMAKEPLRKGTTEGQIVCVLGEGDRAELLVKRTFTADGKTALEITSAEGYKAPTPQAILDSLCGKIAFDPLAFTRMDDRKQLETLRGMVGLDFSEIDANRKHLFDERTAVNKEHKAFASQATGIVIPEGTPDAAVSVEGLMAELRNRQDHNRKNQAERDRVAACEQAILNSQKEFVRCESSIAELESKLIKLRSDREAAKSVVEQAIMLRDTQKSTVAALEDADTTAIEQQVSAASATNASVERARHRLELEVAALKAQEEADRLTAEIEELDSEKQRKLSAVTWPIEGLGFGDNGVTYNGLPFSQASSAEQLRVSVAMGAAMNPRLKVMLCRDASLLDADEMKAVVALAEKYDLQLWMEVVSAEAGPTGILIEDGMVVGAAPVEPLEKPKRGRKPKAKEVTPEVVSAAADEFEERHGTGQTLVAPWDDAPDVADAEETQGSLFQE